MAIRLFLIVVLLLALAAGGYWYWTTTPQYSMQKLSESVKKHDSATFHEYFDVPSVSSNAVDDLLADRLHDAGGPGLLERFLGNAIIGIFKPELVQHLSNSINNYVAKPVTPAPAPEQIESPPAEAELSLKQEVGRLFKRIGKRITEALKPPPLKEVLKDLGITKENYRGLTPFETNGDICHVGLRFQPPDKPELVVQVELHKIENHWRVEKFSNLDELAKTTSGF